MKEEFDIENYDLIRMYRLKTGGGAACVLENHYLLNMTHVFVLKLKPYLKTFFAKIKGNFGRRHVLAI